MNLDVQAERHSTQQRSGDDIDRIACAREAAELVFDDRPVPPGFEPTSAEEARAAVQRLAELFEEVPGAIARGLDGARSSGAQQSSDRLQGIAEIIQNADDVAASEVILQLRPNDLLASHNGAPVRLDHVLALAIPWLTTKADDARAIGRFGIGLSTLQSLSPTLEVHCAPYNVEVGDPTVAPVHPPDLPPRFSKSGWTTLRIPLPDGTLQPWELDEWLDRWDDSALLFLRHVARVALLDPNGDPVRELALSRHRDEHAMSSSKSATVSRELAGAADGRSWAVYISDVPTPEGVSRAHKATGPTTPVAIALPLNPPVSEPDDPRRAPIADVEEVRGPAEAGQVYAGLAVARMRSPLFVSAQFDPLTSREGLAPTPWNEELVKLVAGVWSTAVLDHFGRDPQAAWQTVPLPCTDEGEATSGVIGALEAAVIERARQDVASRLSFPVSGRERINLSELAVEARPLERILHETEVAQLAGLSATLPIDVRDPAGRWRSILHDWRSHGADLPEPVSVRRALDLVGDEGRPVGSTIALVAAALQEDLKGQLLRLPCVTAHDGRRLVPPAGSSTRAVSVKAVPLAEQLGITTRLHPAHLDSTNGAPEVLDWLRECGALLKGSDDREVVRRLAKAGQSGNCIEVPLTDEQVRALGDAFEHMSTRDQAALGPQVGRAVRLESYTNDAGGQKKPGAARPADAYVPRAVDRAPDSFAVAAGKTRGLTWLSDSYAKTLRSQAGREGIGALRFLRLLGAETAPRLRPHPQLWKHYQNDDRKGLPVCVEGGPESRRAAMKERGATYTLDDHDSPDLLAVITDIASERRSKPRRERAGALLAALARAWDRRIQEYAEVEAADGHYRWNKRGKISAFWLAQAGDVAWLDDRSGTPRLPTELRVHTPGTEAIYGSDSPDYLHPELDQPSQPGRRALLAALGVSSDPSRSELVERLRELERASEAEEVSSDDQRHESALIYRALAQSLNSAPADSDLTTDQLRKEFARGRLVLTNLGWLPSLSVLAGPPIFRDLRPFAPAIRDCEPLWRTFQLKEPSPGDCVEVLREVARRRKHAPDTTEEALILETLRQLAQHHARGATVERRKLSTLALWTTKGWTRGRPVYATDDPVLAEGLRDRLPMWQPGGELEQFRSLIEPLRVTEIPVIDTRVTEPELAQEHDDLTELFQRTVDLLRNELQRNDPDLAGGLTVPWDSLATHVVKVHPSLALAVTVAAGQVHSCEVNAKVDSTTATVFVKEPAVLARVAGGGRAVATLFEGDARRVAQEWRAAYDLAQDGIEAQQIELARELEARERAEFDDGERLDGFRERAARGHGSTTGHARRADGRTAPSDAARSEDERRPQSRPVAAPRVLVEPQSLMLVDSRGRKDEGFAGSASGTSGGATRGGGLREPRAGSSGPQSRTSLRAYSDVERESVGLELLRMLLGSDSDQIVDLRNQRGVGADAVDELKNYYELKVHAGPEPDQVTLTDSEVERAHTTPNFFLVVVSNVEEGSDERPTIRVVADPLNQLRQTYRGTVTLSGVREAASLAPGSGRESCRAKVSHSQGCARRRASSTNSLLLTTSSQRPKESSAHDVGLGDKGSCSISALTTRYQRGLRQPSRSPADSRRWRLSATWRDCLGATGPGEVGADVVAVDAHGRVDELYLGTDGHRMVGLQRCQRLVDGVDQPGEETLDGLRHPAGTDPCGHVDEPVGRVAVGNAVVVAGRGPGAEGVEGGQAVVEGRSVDGLHEGVHVGQGGQIGGVFDDDVGHERSDPPRLYGPPTPPAGDNPCACSATPPTQSRHSGCSRRTAPG